MGSFIAGGEGGATSARKLAKEMQKRGALVDDRAPRLHARSIGGHGAMLRRALRAAGGQLDGMATVKHRRAETVCRLQGARAFIGAVFDDAGPSMARADPAPGLGTRGGPPGT
eukprot:5827360-Pyramimonas_sp.AAC.1